MVEGIKVFFSYSHRDEQLRDELAKHLSAMRRQGVIAEWHDRKITAGNEWAGAIDENLNSANIILLLISADFLASDYCYDVELKRAMERHDAGEARIIPVILRPVDWRGEAFGKLQALPKDATPITRWADRDEAFADVARGLRAAVEERKVQQAIPARRSHNTYIVDQMHRGDFATISEAIKAAKPGDRILVRPGLYQEGLVIDKPLEIVGDGERDEIVVQARGQDAILFQTTRGRVAKLTIRQIGGDGTWYGVDITQGRLELEDCDISSQSSCCVAIHDGADPRVRRNYIHDGNGSGIHVYDGGRGILEDNEIFENANTGVAIATKGNPIVRRNRIRDGKGNGVHSYEDGQGTLEDNEIFGNAYPGIEIGAKGNMVVRRNLIVRNDSYGVRIYANGGGTFEDNDLRGNAKGAWNIVESSPPNVIRRNNTPNE